MYEKQKATGNIRYNDKLDFEFVQNAYWRSLKKRKAEGKANHEEYVQLSASELLTYTFQIEHS
jgi:hypothetical protein